MARSKGDIKTKIESTFCPVHRERPVITIVNENDINIYGCCVEFEDNCRKEIQKILREESQNPRDVRRAKGNKNVLGFLSKPLDTETII